MKADFLLYDRANQPLLVCEVKATKNEDEVWARKLRRNLLAHDLLPEAPYFLLVLPTRTYLWKDASPFAEAPPTFQAKTWELLRPYLTGLNEESTRLGEASLELAVAALLEDITGPLGLRHGPSDKENILELSGLTVRAKNGILLHGDTIYDRAG